MMHDGAVWTESEGNQVVETRADPGVESRRGLRHRQAMLPRMLGESVIVIALALQLSLIVKTWLMQAFFIPSISMENTLVEGDRVIVNELVPSPISLQRGDVIVFEDPDHWLPAAAPVQRSALSGALNSTPVFAGLQPSDASNHLIKGVIGLPGDHVVCCTKGGQLSVNGAGLSEPYLFPGDAPSRQPFNITVPAGKVWVMGDHRSESGESRPHDENLGGANGSVSQSLIVGRAIVLGWPLNHWSWLSYSSETFAKVAGATTK